MNLALRKPMTLAEFLEWEERQPQRYEFDGVGPVAMTGGTYGHSTIQGNLATAVGGHLRGKPCRFHGSDLKFQVAEGHIRYPDGMVVCVPIRLTQTPTRCRVRPRAGIEVGIGRRLNTACDAEQRAEGVERVEPPVEAERELIEVGL